MYNYCTLFDSNYLSRGLAMYESLAKHSKEFQLYIFAFDQLSLEILNKLGLQNVTVISLKEFESQELLALKPTRSAAEYCWTCTPSTVKYSIETYDLDHCTYLDADLYFYSNPQILVDEMGDKSVLISEHRYTPKYDQSKASGIYCVQFMTFKNDTNGMFALKWWQAACNEWCYARFEDGKFGDQKYLDDWTTRFEGVHVMRNEGGGVAPWNVQQYTIDSNNIITNKRTEKQFQLVFYHYHHLRLHSFIFVDLGIYTFINASKQLYSDYIKRLLIANKRALSITDAKSNYHATKYTIDFLAIMKSVKRGIANNALLFRKY